MENKKVLFIDANRNGYGIDQCGRTMTVGELIAWLEQFDEDMPVYLRHDGGYTYGNIIERHFEEDTNDEEDC